MNGHGALIVGAAPVDDRSGHYARLISRATTVIAADGGLLTCLAADRMPDVCVGDFDSTPPEALIRAAEAGAEIHRYPAVKDVSDLDLALGVARERGCRPVVLCGAFTARIDHTLTALATLVSAADLDAYADEPGWVAVPLDAALRPSCDLAVPAGGVVSVLAFGGSAVVSAEGFEYPMELLDLEPLSSLGLSNVSRDSCQSVRVEAGRALIIINRSAGASPLQPPLPITDIL
ncbi:MAG: thiamine diphosphokinase [Coriobacteriia bacterium]